jgi:hypothetical protein
MATKVKRILFTPSEEAASVIQELENQGKTRSEIINKSVIAERAIRKAVSEGGAVYIEKANGDRERIVLVG